MSKKCVRCGGDTGDMWRRWDDGLGQATCRHLQPRDCITVLQANVEMLQNPEQLAKAILKEFTAAGDDASWDEGHPIFGMAAHIDQLKACVVAMQDSYKEMADYLDQDPKNHINSGSTLHKQMRQYASKG